MRELPVLTCLALGACGLGTEPDTRLAYVDRVELPAAVHVDVPAQLTIVYTFGGCDEVAATPTHRTPGTLTVGVLLRDGRRPGTACPDILYREELRVPIEPPVVAPLSVTVRRMQGDTTYTIPAEARADHR